MKRYFFIFLLWLYAVTVRANHWEPDAHQFPDNMNVIGVIEINGIEQATNVFELGAFCGDECRGSEMLTFYEGLNRYMLFMTIYGQSGHVLSFSLYDLSSQQELVLTSPETMQFFSICIVGAISDPYVFSFSGGMGMITTNALPEEGGTVTGGGAYWIGETCTLQATTNEGYIFVDWTENGQQVSSEPVFSLLVTSNHDLQANFTFDSYEITVGAQPIEGGHVAGMGTYVYGATATVSAISNEHYEFVNWIEDGIVVSNTAEYTFVVDGNRHLVATFALESYAINASVSPENAGFIEGMGSYAYGQTATLIAYPNDDYEFLAWTENGVFVSDQTTISLMVTQNRNLEACFTYYDSVGEMETTVSVFPNPTSGIVTIKGLNEGCVVHLIDENGRFIVLNEIDEKGAVVDLGFVPDGCYTLFVPCDEKKHVVRLIKASR